MTCVVTYDAPVGRYYLFGDKKGLTGIWLEGQKYFPKEKWEEPLGFWENEVLVQTQLWLDRYFAGECPAPQELPLYPEGSPFQRRIWQALLEIPYGSVTTYGAIAKQVGKELGKETLSPQAVGGAVSHNPISIVIPCHRVVGANGTLTGYAGGVEVKQWLLKHEGVKVEQEEQFHGMEGR